MKRQPWGADWVPPCAECGLKCTSAWPQLPDPSQTFSSGQTNCFASANQVVEKKEMQPSADSGLYSYDMRWLIVFRHSRGWYADCRTFQLLPEDPDIRVVSISTANEVRPNEPCRFQIQWYYRSQNVDVILHSCRSCASCIYRPRCMLQQTALVSSSCQHTWVPGPLVV